MLLQTSSFAYLYGGAGLAVLDLSSDKSPTFGQVISAHAFSGRQAYGVQAVQTILTLPPGTVTQRALVYAMRMHPERPQSVWGSAHPVLMQHARLSSQLMVQYGSVGHHDWGNRLSQIGSQAGLSPFEVAASSYGASPLIDAAFELVQNWRGSPAHWGACRHRSGTSGTTWCRDRPASGTEPACSRTERIPESTSAKQQGSRESKPRAEPAGNGFRTGSAHRGAMGVCGGNVVIFCSPTREF